MKRNLFFALILGIIFMGCHRVMENSDLSELSGKWETTRLSKNSIIQQLVISGINFETKNGTTFAINGNSGVNSFFGDVIVKGKSFSAGDNIGSTKMAGPATAMEFEDDFLQCITGAEKIQIEDDGKKLVITNSKKDLELTFKKTGN